MTGGAYDDLFTRIADGLSTFAGRLAVDGARWRGPVLPDEEVEPFLRAVDAGLVELHGEVCVISGLRTGAPPKRYQLFSSYDGGLKNPGRVLTWSWREMFTQVAFAAELVLDHGWPVDGVVLEIGHLDVGAGDPATVLTAPLLAAEAKTADTGPQGLTAMMAVFAEMNGTGAVAAVPIGVHENAERKYQSLAKLRPRVFVEVAPGVRRGHRLEYLPDGRILFRPGTVLRPAQV